ncbi:hypothetical protein V2A60_001954 [Cordyceps javanica]
MHAHAATAATDSSYLLMLIDPGAPMPEDSEFALLAAPDRLRSAGRTRRRYHNSRPARRRRRA